MITLKDFVQVVNYYFCYLIVNVLSTLYSIINTTTGKYWSVTFTVNFFKAGTPVRQIAFLRQTSVAS